MEATDMKEYIVTEKELGSAHDYFAELFNAKELIRCKDCKWWSPNRKTCIEWADYCFRESKNCILTHFPCRESDYCSWAWTGRKEE